MTQSPYPTVSPGQTFQIFFEVRNTGTCTWRQSDDYYLGNINGTPLGANPRQELDGDVPPNATKRWTIDMVAPTTPGTYRTQWMVKHGDNTFGPDMFIGVTVSQPLRVIAPLTLTPANPISGQTVTAQLTVKNVGEQAIGLRYLTVSARGPDSPDCTDWDCPWADFPSIEDLTLQPNQEYTYYGQRSFTEVGDYFAQANYQGQHDPEELWYPFGNQVEFTVSPGLTVVEPLTLTPANPIAGQTVTAQFTVKNVSDQAITLPILTVPARGPSGPACTDWDCPWADFQAVEDVTLQPGEEYAYSAQRSFDKVGDYFAQPDYQDAGGYWHPFGNRVDFSVSPGVQVVEDLSLSPADPVVGQTITARFKIKNASEQTITLRRLVVGAKGPNCTDWECPNWGDFPAYEHLTLQPGEEFIYERQRLYTQAGDGYFAQIVYQYGENDWHHIGTTIDFAVSPGLQVVEDLTLSPASPLANQLVTARYKVKNMGGRAITLRRLGVVARGPDCTTGWDCPDVLDFPAVENLALQPNEEYTYSQQRSFTEAGGGYFAEPAFEDPNGWWFPTPGGSRVEFSVSPDLILRDPLTISPSNPVVGQPVTFQFTVANVSAQVITLHYLTVRIHRANCTGEDCLIVELPGVENLTLQPNMEYTYGGQWTFTEADCYFAEPVYQDASGTWHLSLPDGNRVEFCVSPTDSGPVLNGRVALERRGDPGDDRWITQLYRDSGDIRVDGIKVYEAGTTNLLGTFSTTTDANGHFSVELTGIGPGTYDISVKGATTLSNKRFNISLPSDTAVDFGTLRVGDSTGDDRVNGADVSYMVPSFLLCSGDGDFRPYADTNKDDCINGADVSALVPNFLQSGDDVGAAEIPPQSVQLASGASLTLSLSSTSVQAGDIFTLDIVADTGTGTADTVDAYLDFDPKYLEVVDESGRPATAIEPNTELFDFVTFNAVNNEAGQINLSASKLGSPLTGTFTVATIHFRARAEADATDVILIRNGARMSGLYHSGKSLNAAIVR